MAPGSRGKEGCTVSRAHSAQVGAWPPSSISRSASHYCQALDLRSCKQAVISGKQEEKKNIFGMVYRPRYLKRSKISSYQLITNVPMFIKLEKNIQYLRNVFPVLKKKGGGGTERYRRDRFLIVAGSWAGKRPLKDPTVLEETGRQKIKLKNVPFPETHLIISQKYLKKWFMSTCH